MPSALKSLERWKSVISYQTITVAFVGQPSVYTGNFYTGLQTKLSETLDM